MLAHSICIRLSKHSSHETSWHGLRRSISFFYRARTRSKKLFATLQADAAGISLMVESLIESMQVNSTEHSASLSYVLLIDRELVATYGNPTFVCSVLLCNLVRLCMFDLSRFIKSVLGTK